jgi:branched-chain amino acid transport system ATP-binding protein
VDAAVGAPALVARALEVGYGHVPVLHNVTIEVQPGEIVAVLGPNGAGKSTLMSTLAGFLTPSAGSIELFGEGCRDSPNRRSRRGMAFLGEDRHVFPTLTVSQNLRLVRHGDRVFERFPELERMKRRKAGLLSGGEQQMLALGRALATGPKALLIDELSLGLAPLVRERLLLMLREVADEGMAVLIVEQSVQSVLDVADRAYVLRRGEVVDHRPTQEWRDDLDELATLFLS